MKKKMVYQVIGSGEFLKTKRATHGSVPVAGFPSFTQKESGLEIMILMMAYKAMNLTRELTIKALQTEKCTLVE